MHKILFSGLLSYLLILPQAMSRPLDAPNRLASLTSAQAGLSAEQIQQLKSLGIKIIVPGYVPKGFRVYSVSAQNLIGGPGGGPQYQIAYAAEHGAEMFAIVGVSGGIGGAPADKVETIFSPEFGALKMLTQIRKGQKPALLTEWLGKGPFYQLESPALVNRKLQPQAMAADEFAKVCKYLTTLQL